jgi:hypothetical protein
VLFRFQEERRRIKEDEVRKEEEKAAVSGIKSAYMCVCELGGYEVWYVCMYMREVSATGRRSALATCFLVWQRLLLLQPLASAPSAIKDFVV